METARAATVDVIDAEADLAEPDRTLNLTGFMIGPRFVVRIPGAGVRRPEENGLTVQRAADEQERPEWYQGRRR
jgi:hypothetical protein